MFSQRTMYGPGDSSSSHYGRDISAIGGGSVLGTAAAREGSRHNPDQGGTSSYIQSGSGGSALPHRTRESGTTADVGPTFTERSNPVGGERGYQPLGGTSQSQGDPYGSPSPLGGHHTGRNAGSGSAALGGGRHVGAGALGADGSSQRRHPHEDPSTLEPTGGTQLPGADTYSKRQQPSYDTLLGQSRADPKERATHDSGSSQHHYGRDAALAGGAGALGAGGAYEYGNYSSKKDDSSGSRPDKMMTSRNGAGSGKQYSSLASGTPSGISSSDPAYQLSNTQGSPGGGVASKPDNMMASGSDVGSGNQHKTLPGGTHSGTSSLDPTHKSGETHRGLGAGVGNPSDISSSDRSYPSSETHHGFGGVAGSKPDRGMTSGNDSGSGKKYNTLPSGTPSGISSSDPAHLSNEANRGLGKDVAGTHGSDDSGSPSHHYGRDAAIAGTGAAVAGTGYGLEKNEHESHEGMKGHKSGGILGMFKKDKSDKDLDKNMHDKHSLDKPSYDRPPQDTGDTSRAPQSSGFASQNSGQAKYSNSYEPRDGVSSNTAGSTHQGAADTKHHHQGHDALTEAAEDANTSRSSMRSRPDGSSSHSHAPGAAAGGAGAGTVGLGGYEVMKYHGQHDEDNSNTGSTYGDLVHHDNHPRGSAVDRDRAFGTSPTQSSKEQDQFPSTDTGTARGASAYGSEGSHSSPTGTHGQPMSTHTGRAGLTESAAQAYPSNKDAAVTHGATQGEYAGTGAAHQGSEPYAQGKPAALGGNLTHTTHTNDSYVYPSTSGGSQPVYHGATPAAGTRQAPTYAFSSGGTHEEKATAAGTGSDSDKLAEGEGQNVTRSGRARGNSGSEKKHSGISSMFHRDNPSKLHKDKDSH